MENKDNPSPVAATPLASSRRLIDAPLILGGTAA